MGSRPSPAVIANRLLSDFSEDGMDRSQQYTGHGVPFGLAISEEVVILPGLCGFQGTCTWTGLNCYRRNVEKVFFVPSPYTSLFVEK